jgi:UPF0755 protein
LKSFRWVFLFLVLVGLIVGWMVWAMLRPGPGHDVNLEVEIGAPTIQVLRQLKDRGLLPSVTLGRAYLRLSGGDRSPRYGSYNIPARSRPVDVLERLLEGRVETVEITVVEGSTANEIYEILQTSRLSSQESWEEIVHRTECVDDRAPQAESLEGFLFPDTYRFAVGLPVTEAVRHMVRRSHTVWTEEAPASTSSWGSPYEVLTLASLVEGETSVPEERARVAGVFINRLRRGMLLQCDPTVVYALKRQGQWTGRLLRVHWAFDDPYNTYVYPGLPPGPINNPGRLAISAALEPEVHDFLYFVARPGGGHTFSKTLREHNRAVAELRRSRR